MHKKDATFAIFRRRDEVQTAIRSLKKLGFPSNDLWVLQAKGGIKDFPNRQKAQFKSGAVIGAVLGAIIIGGFCFFASGEWASLNAGVQPITASMPGPFTTVAGILFGAIFGAACGTLVGIGTPAPAARRYGQYLQSGGILLSVHTEDADQARQAERVLTATGGQDVQVKNEFDTWVTANMERIDLEKFENQTPTLSVV